MDPTSSEPEANQPSLVAPEKQSASRTLAEQRHPRILRIGFALLILSAALGFGYVFRDVLTIDNLARNEEVLRDYQSRFPLAVALVAFALYVAITGLSLPGAALMTLVCGWYFGFAQGLVIVSLASTLGATLSFLMSRYLLRDWVMRRMGTWYQKLDAAVEREGAYYLFTLRLLPTVPFFVINAVMGLTRIRVATFWWVSQLGMLPGTVVYTYAGSTLPSPSALKERGIGAIVNPQIAVAFVLLGVTPLVIKRLLSWRASRTA